MSTRLDRRAFLATTTGAATVALWPAVARANRGSTDAVAGIALPGNGTPHLTWTVFSRHLQWLTTQSYAQSNPLQTGVLIGQTAGQLGFSAVDLTVRSGGHVEPAQVTTNLSPMVEGIRSTGVLCEQITAGLVDLTTEYASDILTSAAMAGITKYRFGNYRYSTATPALIGRAVLDELDAFRPPLLALQEFNRQLGLLGFYYTFSGANVGASTWDIAYIFSDGQFDPRYIGIDYASAHEVAGGAAGNWSTELALVMPWVRGISLGDTTLVLAPGSATDVGAFPGTGIVNWQTFFTLLLTGGFNGPLSELFEYTLDGVSLNNTWWADTLPSALTPAALEASMAGALEYFKGQATAAGWTAAQQT